MIEGYVGRPGAGKTYMLTKRLLKIADGGRPVYANYHINHPNVTFFNPLDLMDLPPGVVALDEAHLYFPARGALKLPMSWLAMMSQTRKRGWDIFYTTQHENRLDRVVRDITNLMWLTRAIGSGETPWWFAAYAYEPEYFRKPKRAMLRSYSRFDRKIAAAYDTYETIEEAEHLKGADVYRGTSAQRAGTNVQVGHGGSGGAVRSVSDARDDSGLGPRSGSQGDGGGAGFDGAGGWVLPGAALLPGVSDGGR